MRFVRFGERIVNIEAINTMRVVEDGVILYSIAGLMSFIPAEYQDLLFKKLNVEVENDG